MTHAPDTSTNALEARLRAHVEREADPLEPELIALFRELPEADQEALLRHVERRKQGVPHLKSTVRFYRDCGMTRSEAKRQAARALAVQAKDPGHGPIPFPADPGR